MNIIMGAMNLIIIRLHAQQDGAFRLCKVCNDASLLLLEQYRRAIKSR